MSRRKQPNPNKVRLMENGSKYKVSEEDTGIIMVTREERPVDKTSAIHSEDLVKHTERRNTEKSSENGAEGADGILEETYGVDLSSINSMMSTVMNLSTLSAPEVDSASCTLTKSSVYCKPVTSKSPSISHLGKKNQEAKEESVSFICPLCDKNCLTQHQLTMHIRQHNQNSGVTDHSCSICSKSLSSASSLDRHMLVHSGERPYKCSVCGQSFTTNGNMHRHMKIHDKGYTSSIPNSPPSPTKRRRPSAKRKGSQDEDGERTDEANKMVFEEKGENAPQTKGEDDTLPCPICFKAFRCKSDLETHMDTHLDSSLRCDLCCLSFRTHRGLLRHNAATHHQLPTDPSGRPFIQSNPFIPLGFRDLAFIDFSCHKFPQIAQVWCETNLRRCTSKIHCFVCDLCDKAFPLRSALDLHKDTHQPKEGSLELSLSPGAEFPPPEKFSFMDCLGLQHISRVDPVPSKTDAYQSEVGSIRVIHMKQPTPCFPKESGILAGLDEMGFHLIDPLSLQNLSQCEALSLLSLKSLQAGFVLQPDVAAVAKPGCGEASLESLELSGIQQILKVASAAPNQIVLPAVSKVPYTAVQPVGHKQMPRLKPKPLVAPRTNLSSSTPLTLISTHQASLGCFNPNLPPPKNQLLQSSRKISSTSSTSFTVSGHQTSAEMVQMEEDCMGDAQMPQDSDNLQIQSRAGECAEVGRRVCLDAQPQKASYPCKFCNQIFAFSSLLQAHMRYHLGILPHQCNICDYVAPDKATLVRHLRTHSGERPYVCRVCHYPFTVKANCERHLRKKHMKNTRREIEKNIKYITSTSTASLPVSTQEATQEQKGATDTLCRLCGDDLKTYRALQVHLHTHSRYQHKPFECHHYGTTFLTKRNSIHHILKGHPEIQEQIEEHIAPILSSQASKGLSPSSTSPVPIPPVKVEDLSLYTDELEQPLDFSNKSLGGSSAGSPEVKAEGSTSSLLSDDFDIEPIDLSIPKHMEKRMKMEMPVSATEHGELKETSSTCLLDHSVNHIVQTEKDEKLLQLGCYHVPLAVALSINTEVAASRALHLKPLLPKPTSSTLRELPPLASIAQIISSVSAAPDLLKRDSFLQNSSCPNREMDTTGKVDSTSQDGLLNDLSLEGAARQYRKRLVRCVKGTDINRGNTGSGVDLESSGEFASIEKMLATTNTNKFSPYLQSGALEIGQRAGDISVVQLSERKEEKQQLPPQQGQHMCMHSQPSGQLQQPPKGKKNAYSNSVQKMTCPFCPRVFPWASSLQRHMLTHTGQKPYPCPKCDALFSTKSNCERHLLRKHGVTNRVLRGNGVMVKAKETEEGSPESTENMSETELPIADAVNLSGADISQSSTPGTQKASPPAAPSADTDSTQPEEAESQTDLEQNSTITIITTTHDNDDDVHSSKSLDLNFASKLIDFKFSEHGPQSQTCPPDDSSEKTAVVEEKDLAVSIVDKHICKTCGKSFRYAATLDRHEKAHLYEHTEDGVCGENKNSCTNIKVEGDMETEQEDDRTAESSVDSGSEEDEEKEDRSDEEGGWEPKNREGNAGGGVEIRADKRKKVCSVCNKRFWSLQDLTRHMRSHTGERPYRCITCERTFTLKHSLVRHQRIHQKPQTDVPNGGGGTSGSSISEGEGSDHSTNPHSENEQEIEGTDRSREEHGGQPNSPLTDGLTNKKLTQVSNAANFPEDPKVKDLQY